MRRALVLLVVPLLLGLGCDGNPPTAPNHLPPAPAPPPGPAPQPAPSPQAVTHTLIMTASASCTGLPDAARIRKYPAQFQEKPNGDLLVWVVNSGDIMVGWGNDYGFTGRRDGATVSFVLTDDLFAAYAMIERIPGIGDLGYAGAATGRIDENGTVVATFDGEYRLGYGRGPVLCGAPDHLIEVTPTSR